MDKRARACLLGENVSCGSGSTVPHCDGAQQLELELVILRQCLLVITDGMSGFFCGVSK